MARTLDVYLQKDLVGHLIQDDGGQMVFDYGEGWLNRAGACALSQSLPLRRERFTRKECRAFFAGVLPEESKREIIARNLGISARNDYAMLERIGGECAGAVTFVPAGEPLPEQNYSYHPLTDEELATILEELPKRPLLAGKQGVRLSLAGAQDKIAVRVDGKQVSLPLGGAPSTHILKPGIERYEGVVFNEAFTMQLAAEIGLNVARVETRTVEGMSFLLVERYDRISNRTDTGESSVARVHQEDFCQALGVVPEMKYQKEGGPSLKDCFQLLREVSSAPVIDLARLLDAVIFNYMVGNNDAHGKNFSLLYPGAGTGDMQVRLASLYDIVCTAYYPELSDEMAMKIGGEYLSRSVTLRRFEKFAEDAGLAKPLVRRRVMEVAEKILAAAPKLDIENSVTEGVAALITGRVVKAVAHFRDRGD